LANGQVGKAYSATLGATGNGIFDGVSAFGDSILRLSTSSGLSLTDWFTPHNQLNLDGNDSDVAQEERQFWWISQLGRIHNY
jgi:hypothetical protein